MRQLPGTEHSSDRTLGNDALGFRQRLTGRSIRATANGWMAARIALQGRADQREVTQAFMGGGLSSWMALSIGPLTGWNAQAFPQRVAARRHLTAGEVGVCRDELLLVVLIAARGRRGLPCQGRLSQERQCDSAHSCPGRLGRGQPCETPI